MAARDPSRDPYRTLGILWGAEPDEIKAAHRRLAKRFHPDGSMGDEQRFLDVQEAYQLLSDPLRRREWDRGHAPGPLRASAPTQRGSAAEAAGRSRATEPTSRRGWRPGRAARPATPPGARTTTWSAEHVPWWDGFSPRTRRRQEAEPAGSTAAESSGSPAAESTELPRPPSEPVAGGGDAPALDFDVFSRSSGAAWSMAARRHFRRGDEELPSRGAWRYRGTQVVTGAEARKVAAEEAAERVAAERVSADATAQATDTPEERPPR